MQKIPSLWLAHAQYSAGCCGNAAAVPGDFTKKSAAANPKRARILSSLPVCQEKSSHMYRVAGKEAPTGGCFSGRRAANPPTAAPSGRRRKSGRGGVG